MSTPIDLRKTTEWATLWDELAGNDTRNCYVFKHSPYCPMSRYVDSIVQAFASELSSQNAVAVFRVDVVNDRAVAQTIAADTGVRHQSPQVILLGPERRVIWHGSHYGINDESLRKTLVHELPQRVGRKQG